MRGENPLVEGACMSYSLHSIYSWTNDRRGRGARLLVVIRRGDEGERKHASGSGAVVWAGTKSLQRDGCLTTFEGKGFEKRLVDVW